MLTALPGMETMMTTMMQKKIAEKGVASIQELRDICQESGVRLVACQMTVDLFDMNPDEFIEGIDYAGAADFFAFAGESDICLYM
jgi:peroxiredoxin family protein